MREDGIEPRTKSVALSRRIFSGLCAAFLLAVVFFSSAFIAHEANHDCSGHDCPVCQEMQAFVANVQLLGSSVGGTALVATPSVADSSDSCAVCAYCAPALTLQCLDVRFDE